MAAGPSIRADRLTSRASVKAYLALKIVGHESDEPVMKKACEAILAAGGAERVNSFTRYYLALLGIIGYHQCPAVPPELVLLPGGARSTSTT